MIAADDIDYTATRRRRSHTSARRLFLFAASDAAAASYADIFIFD